MGYIDDQRAQEKAKRVRAQQQVQQRLKAGKGIDLYSANPLEAAVQKIDSFFGIGKPLTAYSAESKGQNRLIVPYGWRDPGIPSNVNVAGRTWDLAQQGSDAVYIPRVTTTPLNSVLPKRRIQNETATDTTSNTSITNPAAERAYRQEVSNIAQQAAQNPELQRYADRAAAAAKSKDQGKMDAARDIGMQIWAQKHGGQGGLASKVKAGQSGYDVIQRTLGAGQMGSPMNFGFDSSKLLGSSPSLTGPFYESKTPLSATSAVLPGATSLPSNAFSGMVTTPFSLFNKDQSRGFLDQSLTSAPLAVPGEQPSAAYAGSAGVGAAGLAPFSSDQAQFFASEKAKALLEAFKNAQFGVQK